MDTMNDPVDSFRALVSNVRPAGPNKWTAQCPAHTDENPSLSISRGPDGQLLLHCHTGCSFEAIMAAVGLKPCDAFPKHELARAQERRRTPGKPQSSRNPRTFESRQAILDYLTHTLKGDLGDEWIYRDRAGAELLRVTRFDGCQQGSPKQYRPLFERDGKWHLGDPPGLLPLYRLHEIAQAETVWVCEGEKCADHFHAIGLSATTSAHGANAASKSDWSILAGKRVILCPDNDDAGERYIADVSKALALLDPAPAIRIVRLPLLNKGDDLEQFVSARRLMDRTDQDIRSELEELANAAVVQARSINLDMVRLSDVTPTKQPYLWPGRIVDKAVTLIGGRQGETKNLFVYEIIACVTTGRPWPDDPSGIRRRPRNVFLLEAEENLESSIVPRLTAAGADLSRVRFIRGIPATMLERTKFISIQRDAETIEHAARELGDVALVVVSPITSYLGNVEQNRNEKVRNEIIHPLKTLAEKIGCAVIVLKHPNKEWKNNSPLERIGGSAAWTEAMRCVIFIGVDPDESKDEKNPRRCAAWIKFSVGPKPAPLSWRIRLDESGEPALEFLNDPITFSASEMLAGKRQSDGCKSKQEAAADWIVQVLLAGPQRTIFVNDCAIQESKSNPGFSLDAYERTRARMHKNGRLMYKRKPGAAPAEWWYWLPDHAGPEWFVGQADVPTAPA